MLIHNVLHTVGGVRLRTCEIERGFSGEVSNKKCRVYGGKI